MFNSNPNQTSKIIPSLNNPFGGQQNTSIQQNANPFNKLIPAATSINSFDNSIFNNKPAQNTSQTNMFNSTSASNQNSNLNTLNMFNNNTIPNKTQNNNPNLINPLNYGNQSQKSFNPSFTIHNSNMTNNPMFPQKAVQNTFLPIANQ
jgi:hypothetical protein